MKTCYPAAVLTLYLVLLALLCVPLQGKAQEELLYSSGQLILLSGETGGGLLQWHKNASPLDDDGRTVGSQTQVLRVHEAMYDDAGLYALLETQTFWFTNVVEQDGELTTVVTTTNVVYTNALYLVYVQDLPTILNFYHFTAGDNVTFQVEATGGGLSYQWYWQDQPIPGATGSVLTYENAQSSANAGYYSVTVRNLVGEASSPPPGLLFLKAAPRGKYQGIFFNAGVPAIPSTGRIQFNISGAHGRYSGKVTILKQVYSFKGAFDDTHWTTTTAVPKKGGFPLQLTMQLSTLTNSPRVFGTISDGNWSSTLQAHRLAFHGEKNPAPAAGQYTLAFLNTNLSGPAMVPNGNGIGAITLGLSGMVNLSGRVADGTPFSHVSGLSSSGEWPLFVTLPKNRGILFGWLAMGGTDSGSISSQALFWIKDAGPDQYYPDGFNLPLDTIGSTYVPGVSLPLDEGVAAIAAGDLFTDDLAVWNFYRVWQRQPNVWAAEKSPAHLQLSFGRSRGFMSGSFINYMTGLRTPIRGVVLQQQGGALGYFLSVDSSGYFSITPGMGD